jgi:hypothetical protein
MTSSFDDISYVPSSHPATTSTENNGVGTRNDLTPRPLRSSERTTSSNSVTIESVIVGMGNTSISEPDESSTARKPTPSLSDDESDVDPTLRARIEYTRYVGTCVSVLGQYDSILLGYTNEMVEYYASIRSAN